jgi:hypothetical protein
VGQFFERLVALALPEDGEQDTGPEGTRDGDEQE